MTDLIQDMQLKRLITIENIWARNLIESAQRADKLRHLYKLFCMPIFNVSNVYWFIYGQDNKN
jgi:hypothetical protein